MKSGRMADGSEADQIRSLIVFEIPVGREVEQSLEPLRGPLALAAFGRLATKLRAEGFEVSEIKPTSAGSDVFSIRFSRFWVSALICSERVAGLVDCCVRTWWNKHFWRHVNPQVVFEGWNSACAAIDENLRKNPSIRFGAEGDARRGRGHWERKGLWQSPR